MLVDVIIVFYNDSGNNMGVGILGGNIVFGKVVDLINMVGNNVFIEFFKCFYKYVWLYCWSSSVVVVLMLVLVESLMFMIDGGFISGYLVEVVCDIVVMVYLVLECF